ncbi:MAG: glycosyltransferase family 2 protein [Bacteroidales bacterium]|nr:glycosyltransferase family 2 protein [Bacteroidales bacterium]
MLVVLFWILLSIILYAYPGYAVLILLLSGIKSLLCPRNASDEEPFLPDVTLLIAAWNEKELIESKMENTRNLDYPKEKLRIVWITDGSDDGTPEILASYPDVKVLHEPERKGKTAAVNRAMPQIGTPYVVLCDANTMLDPKAITYLMAGFRDERTGCVAGEKRIAKSNADMATGAGEGAYWKYESWIKRLESELYSTVGAAGELYALRTELYEVVNPDSIIDDFVISMSIAQRGFKIAYEPRAFALEKPSASIKDELTRKVRIASGGFQTLFRYPSLLNVFRHGLLSFEYFSHKVIRWILVPFAMPLIFILNFFICMNQMGLESFYLIFLCLQLGFYLFVALGAVISEKSTRLKFLFLPYYLAIMNYAQIAGLVRYLRRKHSVVWEKAKRA